VPDPPHRPNANGYPQLTSEQILQLRDLHAVGKARGNSNPDGLEAVASRELNRLLWNYRQRGYRLVDLADALGVKNQTILFRFGRSGYRELPPSMRRFKPGPITGYANGVNSDTGTKS
jgi:hypothetical protein